MSDDVNVKFGGTTSDLDKASAKAKQDIEGVGKSATGLKGMFQQVASGFKNMFSSAGSEMEKAHGYMRVSASMTGALHENLVELIPLFGEIAAGMSAAFAVKKLVQFGEEMGDLALHLDKVAQKLGITATEVSRLDNVAMMTNMSTSQLEGGMTRLERSMVMAASGGKQQQAVFRALGIDVHNLRNPMDAILQIADKFKTMDNGPKKVALAMALMGRAGADMIPILNQGREGLAEMFKESDEMGATMSNDMINAGLAVHESMDKMKLGLTGVKNVMFEELAPAIVSIVDGFAALVKEFIDSYRHGGTVKTILDTIVVSIKFVITVLAELGTAFKILWHVAEGVLVAIIGTLGTLGTVISKLMSGDFSGAADTFKSGMHATGAAVVDEWHGMTKAAKDYVDFTGRVWSSGSPRPKHPVIDASGGDGDLDVPGLAGGGRHKHDNSKAEARKRLEAKIEELAFEQDLARDDFQKQMELEEQKLEALKDFYGKDSAEYQRELRNKIKMTRDHDQELVRMGQEALQHKMALANLDIDAEHQIDQAELAAERDKLEALQQMGRISEVDKQRRLAEVLMRELQMEMDSENRIFQVHDQELKDELALQNLRPQERQRILNQIETLERAHADKMRVINAQNSAAMVRQTAQTAQAVVNKWRDVVSPITNGFNNLFQGLYTRQVGFKQGMLKLADDLVMNWAQKGFQLLENWITTEIAKTTATEAQSAIRTTTEATAAATSGAITAGHAMAQVTTNAAVGASGAFAATAPIPFVGPALAPGVAAAALAAILGFGAMIASASGGYDIPSGSNPMTQLHAEEMVLPAHIANPLRAALRGSGPQMSGLPGMTAAAGATARQTHHNSSNTNAYLNYNPNISHHDSSLKGMLRRQGSDLRKWLRNEMRNGGLFRKEDV